MASVVYGFLWFMLSKENRARDAGKIRARHENLSEAELAELGDESPHYRYIT